MKMFVFVCWITLVSCPVSCAETSSTREYQYNVSDTTIGGSVSVSINTEGKINALLLLLSPSGHNIKMKSNCYFSDIQNLASVNNKTSTSKTISSSISKKVISSTPMVAEAAPLKSRADTKLTLEDILSADIIGESGSIVASSITPSTTAIRNIKSRNCLDILDQGKNNNGIYIIHPYECCPDQYVEVFCDMTTDGGGWTVIQRRTNTPKQENFFRDWQSYVTGFGDLRGEFWLGLETIHALTNQTNYEIRFDLGDFEDQTRWAKYSSFFVASSSEDYKLGVGGYSGDAGDSFTRHNGRGFETTDHQSMDECANTYKGAWWYSLCHDSNLNGQYLYGEHNSYADGVNWRSWRGYYYSLKFTEMKIRRKREAISDAGNED
ncbi:cell surface pattern recognition receptor signaling pathway [Halocaridina rubra]|uniref:Cell surface pattern recognition receptor signaling pathway n=1 Tax=Halocaridina rubra TaxID=373956 RepID=A0AAN8XE03_HALRR